jgi:chemotaxis protein methyltransferase CheR
MMEPTAEVSAVLADPAFPQLMAHVVASTGLAYFVPREADLAARIRRRMIATASADCTQYLALILQPSAAERDAMINELTIGETHFFRFQEQFEALRSHVFPTLIRQKQHDRRLRIWSAGCATGPEPYSVAIMLEREFGAWLADWQVTILGTDINRESLERAQEGVYGEWALRGLPDDLRRECFSETSDGWRLADPYRRWLTFQQNNLATDPVPAAGSDGGGFDVVLCRNVMIYFSPETIQRVLANLHAAIQPQGWLLVGHAEGNQDWLQDFEPVTMPGTVVYRRRQSGRAESAGVSAPEPPPPRVERYPQQPTTWQEPFDQLMAWRPHPIDETNSAAPTPALSEKPEERLDELRTLANRGEWKAAEASSRSLLDHDPVNALAHFYRGLALAQQGDALGAEAAFRRSIFLEGDLALAYYHLGLLLARRGDRTGAAKAFRNTLRALDSTADEAVVDGDDLTAGRLREAVESQFRSLAA